MVFNPFGSSLAFVWDIIATVISIVILLALVQINGVMQKKGIVSQIITRKFVHIFAGPIFVVTWMLFSGEVISHYIASIVPLLFVLQFIAIGTGVMKNESFVNSMSRTGDPRELLGGTLYYSIVMLLMTFFWFYVPSTGINNANPTALLIIGCVSGGDGLADIIGRKFGGEKKFGIKGSEKTIVGSIGMLAGSILVSSILVLIFSLETPHINMVTLFLPIIVVSIVATIVEALSPKGTDNFLIFLAVIIVILILELGFPDFWPYSYN
ncbi:MAG: diacylglycerol/polyprenol kinase family protein, partial [Promethearchaeota archaeon]